MYAVPSPIFRGRCRRCTRGLTAAMSVDDLPRAVGRSVVDDEHLDPRSCARTVSIEARDVLSLVVRRNDDQRALRHGVFGPGTMPGPERTERQQHGDKGDSLPRVYRHVVKRELDRTRAGGQWDADTLFEELGFYYIGPIDGHNLDHLLPVLENVRDEPAKGPVLIHVVTQKGKGYPPAEAASDKYHGVNRFDVITGTQVKAKSNAPALTTVFAESLVKEAARDPKIVAVTAAMPSGTGLNLFQKAYPQRCFDVGIAEQHAVTFAAGLAAEGYRPFCAIYSTFLQRAYDQVVHDVAIQNLPVRFALDRAGLVGADGATHAGSFDVAYLGCLPNFVLMAAADEAELVHMVATAARHDAGPIALRYPRGEGVGLDLPLDGTPLPIGKGRIVREGSRVALLSYGSRLADCLKAAEDLEIPRPLHHGGRRPLRQAPGHGPDPRPRPPPPGPAHGRGGLDRRLRQLRAAVHARGRAARRGCRAPAEPGAAGPLHRPRHAAGPAGGSRAGCQGHHGRGDAGAGRAKAGRGQGGGRLRGQGKRMNACSCALADEALEVDRVPPRALPAVLERGCGLGLVQQVQGHVPDHGHVLRRMAGAQA